MRRWGVRLAAQRSRCASLSWILLVASANVCVKLIDPLKLHALKGRLTRRVLRSRVVAVLVDLATRRYAGDPEDQGVGRRLRRSGDDG